jgi:hypothetical protein
MFYHHDNLLPKFSVCISLMAQALTNAIENDGVAFIGGDLI